jgi:hypothetical protein
MRPWAVALALLVPAAAAASDPLEAVRGALRQFAGTTPVTATLERSVTSERKDRPLEAGRVTLRVTAGPQGISIGYPDELLGQIRAERAQTDPEQPRPARRTLQDFDAADAADMLNSAVGLLGDLEGATLGRETASEHGGRPARLLELELPVRISKADRKWLKHASHAMKLWVDGDGVPLAAESSFSFSVGLLIFTFEARDFRTQVFGRAGDRLVALHRTSRFDGEGLGESQHTQSETRLRLHPGST